RALDKLRGNISRWTDGWQKNIYISPCFLEAAAAAKLINEWGGGGDVLGFIDKNKGSKRAASCARESGINVYSLNDISSFEDCVILIFGIHADAIARDFESCGLKEKKNFIKTGLI
ncbi:MAG: hypothetical protein LBB22_01620, partial [Treponema sp.]|nr:hypothetical protein [Treponema sp.]